MADPRQGRSGQGGYSPRLGKRDPRLRTNAQAAVTDQDLDDSTIKRDDKGRQRIAALDDLRPLAADATLAQVVTHMNTLSKLLKGLR